jgi:nickel/cobalt exporter
VDTLSLAYLPIAIGLGALHALEPGHAKTMTAAYLIGIHGRWHDAIMLGLSAALTHSLVVIAIAVSAVLIGREAFAGEAIWWLQIGSGSVVILLGAWLLYRRLHPRNRVHHHHREEPAPIVIRDGSMECQVTIQGQFPNEKMHLAFVGPAPTGATVIIQREGGQVERLTFEATAQDPQTLVSRETPGEPHGFTATLELANAAGNRPLSFTMEEHDHEHHGHDDLDDDAHARAHAAQMPAYVGTDVRPAWWQVIAFGAAGGLVPCPASISVMLLALSVGSTVHGLLMVLGFSIGLALALVSVGLVVVVGLRTLGSTGRFAAISRQAPVISASVLILSGFFALTLALRGGH